MQKAKEVLRMRGWIEGMQESIDFIEGNLTEDLEIEEIAGKAALSPFYYQRILCSLNFVSCLSAQSVFL